MGNFIGSKSGRIRIRFFLKGRVLARIGYFLEDRIRAKSAWIHTPRYGASRQIQTSPTLVLQTFLAYLTLTICFLQLEQSTLKTFYDINNTKIFLWYRYLTKVIFMQKDTYLWSK